jgi:hypothetical protein
MTAPKTATGDEEGGCNFAGMSVYEIANAAAREAKRVNSRFSAAKQKPPDNLVRTVLKKALNGQVAYRLEKDAAGNGDGASQD